MYVRFIKAVCLSALQCVAVCCSVLQCVAERGENTKCMCVSLKLCVAMVQCVAVCCSVL